MSDKYSDIRETMLNECLDKKGVNLALNVFQSTKVEEYINNSDVKDEMY